MVQAGLWLPLAVILKEQDVAHFAENRFGVSQQLKGDGHGAPARYSKGT